MQVIQNDIARYENKTCIIQDIILLWFNVLKWNEMLK